MNGGNWPMRFYLVASLLFASWMMPAVAVELPPSLNAALLAKVVSMENRLSAREDLVLMVFNNPALQEQLQSLSNRSDKRVNFQTVVGADTAPASVRPDVIYVNNLGQLQSVIDYAREHRCMLVSHDRELIAEGVAIVLFDDEGLPGIRISKASSRALGLNWNPVLLNFSYIE